MGELVFAVRVRLSPHAIDIVADATSRSGFVYRCALNENRERGEAKVSRGVLPADAAHGDGTADRRLEILQMEIYAKSK
ncbi:MAG: hypothetical protein JWO80_240, partial [Bryobacterales bacterium]|nr:hypothetical protein [Bryobacterales bacterium]